MRAVRAPAEQGGGVGVARERLAPARASSPVWSRTRIVMVSPSPPAGFVSSASAIVSEGSGGARSQADGRARRARERRRPRTWWERVLRMSVEVVS